MLGPFDFSLYQPEDEDGEFDFNQSLDDDNDSNDE